jgi:hypothetical protein
MKSKVPGALFALAFALVFGAGGAFGIASLLGQLHGWWQARSWHTVPATVLTAELKESHGDSTTYEATATYRYVVEGRAYEGTRVGFGHGSDNVGSWQQKQYARLNAARLERRTIDVWVDPADPARSVVDRSLRPGMVAFTVPFATLFPMVSLGALWMLIRILRAPAQETSAPAKPKPNERDIRSDARLSARARWLFATFWGLIAFPVAFVMVPELYGRSWMWLAVMIFPIVGLLLIWAAITQTIRLTRNGEITLRLNPAQPRLGESLTAQATFAQIPATAGEHVFTLLCEKVDTRGEDTRYRTVWKQERPVHRGGTYAAATFLPPPHLPPSEPSTSVYHRWRVLLGFPDGKDERAFDVTIAPSLEDSFTPTQEHGEEGVVDAVPRPVPESLATIVDDSSGLQISYVANASRSGLPVSLFALIFIGVGGFLLSGVASGVGPRFFGFVFAAIGIAVLGAGVYAWTHRRTVAISNGQVRVENHWLLKSGRDEFAVRDVRDVVTRIHGSSSTGRKRYDHHQIKALLRDGREIALASDVRDAGVVVTLQQLIRKHLGLAADIGEAPTPRAASTEAGSAGMTAALADPAKVARIHRGVKLAMTAIVALMLLAVFWDIFAGLLPIGNKEEVRTSLQQVERPDPLSNADLALFRAVERKGSAADVAAALANGASVDALNGWGATPLLVAARLSSAEVVEALIRAGANVNFSVQQDNEYRGRTPLMNAARSDSGDNVRLLLEAGADPQAFESHGWSAAHYAAHQANLEGLKELRQHGMDLDLHSPISRGETPLMIAARFGKLDAIRRLIELGADPRLVDGHGENAYGWAKHFEQREAMEALSAYR